MYHEQSIGNYKYMIKLMIRVIYFLKSDLRFKTAKVAIDSIEFNVPEDIEKFLFDYSHSTFLECNEDLARKNLKSNYFQKNHTNKAIQKELKYISNSLEGLHKEYWLCAGTLLGIFNYKS